MPFEKLPGYNLQVPVIGNVGVVPPAPVIPWGDIASRNIAQISAALDPYEREKKKATLDYLRSRAVNPLALARLRLQQDRLNWQMSKPGSNKSSVATDPYDSADAGAFDTSDASDASDAATIDMQSESTPPPASDDGTAGEPQRASSATVAADSSDDAAKGVTLSNLKLPVSPVLQQGGDVTMGQQNLANVSRSAPPNALKITKRDEDGTTYYSDGAVRDPSGGVTKYVNGQVFYAPKGHTNWVHVGADQDDVLRKKLLDQGVDVYNDPQFKDEEGDIDDDKVRAKYAELSDEPAPEKIPQKLKNEAAQMGVYKDGMTLEEIQDAIVKKQIDDGVIPPHLDGLAKEMATTFQKRPTLKDYPKLVEAKENIDAGLAKPDDHGYSDMAMIEGLQRMLNPGAIVRITTIQQMQDAMGLLAKYDPNFLWNKAISGDKLTPEARQRISDLANEIFNRYSARANPSIKHAVEYARSRGVKGDAQKFVQTVLGMSDDLAGLPEAGATAPGAQTPPAATGTTPATVPGAKMYGPLSEAEARAGWTAAQARLHANPNDAQAKAALDALRSVGFSGQ